jgi:hypothetical protein
MEFVDDNGGLMSGAVGLPAIFVGITPQKIYVRPRNMRKMLFGTEAGRYVLNKGMKTFDDSNYNFSTKKRETPIATIVHKYFMMTQGAQLEIGIIAYNMVYWYILYERAKKSFHPELLASTLHEMGHMATGGDNEIAASTVAINLIGLFPRRKKQLKKILMNKINVTHAGKASYAKRLTQYPSKYYYSRVQRGLDQRVAQKQLFYKKVGVIK